MLTRTFGIALPYQFRCRRSTFSSLVFSASSIISLLQRGFGISRTRARFVRASSKLPLFGSPPIGSGSYSYCCDKEPVPRPWGSGSSIQALRRFFRGGGGGFFLPVFCFGPSFATSATTTCLSHLRSRLDSTSLASTPPFMPSKVAW